MAKQTIVQIINGPLQLGEHVRKDDVDCHEVLDQEGNRFCLAYGDTAETAKVRAQAIVSNINDQLEA